MGLLIGDLSGTWQIADWQLCCSACASRQAGLAFEELPPLFYCVTARGVELKAWNRGHFEMLLRLLSHESIEEDPYRWFATYAHRDWLRGTYRTAFVKQMRRFLAEHAMTD